MRILVDATQIPVQKVGVGVYAYNTFENIIKIDTKNQYIFIVQDDDNDFDYFAGENVKIKKIKASIYRNFFFRFILEQCYLPFYCRKYKIDILHSLHYSFPLCLSKKHKKIVTIHDLTFFIYPKVHTFIKRYYFRMFITLAVKKADRLICVSQSTADDLKRFFPKSTVPIDVAPLAVTDNMIFSDKEIKSTLEKFNLLNTNFVLFIGTLEPRKNITSIIRAYSEIKKSDSQYKLVLVGKKGWFYNSIFLLIKELGIENDVVFTDFVSIKEKYILLSSSTLFVYPSLYEGFGLPVLEAMSYQKPIITSNISSMPEVAGDSAILIDPNNIDELISAMKALLFNDDLAKQYAERAAVRAKLFTWKQTAELTLKSYNSSLQTINYKL
jgi:glycosyltransferase involved in cell wall biosynthesis